MKYLTITSGFFALVLSASPSLAAESNLISLSLDNYVDMALKNSLSIQSAEESLLSSKYSWVGTKRGLTWPTLTASGSQSRNFSDNDIGTETETDSQTGGVTLNQPFLTGTDVSVTGSWTHSETDSETTGLTTTSRTKDKPDLDASVTQPLYIFMKNSKLRSRRLATIGWENAQDTYRQEKLQTEFDARSIYYNLLLNKEVVKVERKKYDSAKLVQKITKSLVRAGKRAKVELLRADIRAKSDSRRIQNVENSFKKEMNEAKDFIVLPVETPIKLTSKLTYVPFNVELNDLVQVGLMRNPPLNRSRRSIESAKIGLQQTKEGNRPDLDVVGTYSKTADRAVDATPLDPYSWSLGVDLTWPFFDATQTRLNRKQSEISLRNIQRSYETQERQLKVDIENAFLDVKRTEEQIEEFSAQQQNAQQTLRAIRLQYKNGLTRLTDVFDAENQLRDLNLEYLGLLVDFNVARDRLSLLIGQDVTLLSKDLP